MDIDLYEFSVTCVGKMGDEVRGSQYTSLTLEVNVLLRCENRPVNRPVNRDTGLEMPCCPVTDLLWV